MSPGRRIHDAVLRRWPAKPTKLRLFPCAVESLPHVAAGELMTCKSDVVHFPNLGGATQPGWMDGTGAPYVMALMGATFYPQMSLTPKPPEGSLPRGLSFKDLGLLVGANGAIYPDSMGKSSHVSSAVTPGAGEWSAVVPDRARRLRGTWLFAEVFFAHFGHALVDNPSRLWPFAAGVVRPEEIRGVIGQSMLGSGPLGEKFPGYARALLNAIGVRDGQIRFVAEPTRVDRLLVPRRIAPYMGLWHPVFSRMLREAGSRIAPDRPAGPERLWMSRSRLNDDPRGSESHALLDALFEEHGFAVVHPQEMPFEEQIALVRTATHIAGPVGSQLHLSGFGTRQGLRVLTIAPSFFRLNINEKLVSDLGGDETHYLVEMPKPEGVRHKAIWSFDPALVPDLRRLLDTWAPR